MEPLTTTVHPHACGEYVVKVLAGAELGGSPPRVWGILDAPRPTQVLARFTPTRVGNTRPASRAWLRPAVHPHACGEYCLAARHYVVEDGSPPRVWGIPLCCGFGNSSTRFTPTRVGNTAARNTPAGTPPVHPHACGEYSAQQYPGWNTAGSPPRVWGILEHLHHVAAAVRFTPTRVGNTMWRCCRLQPDAVHPHACGEYSRFKITCHNCPGSPPRVWGILLAAWACRHVVRFTPTRVGNTRAGGGAGKW